MMDLGYHKRLGNVGAILPPKYFELRAPSRAL